VEGSVIEGIQIIICC